MPYAERTEVPVERSRMEIERILRRYGADGFVYGWDADMAVVGFRAAGRQSPPPLGSSMATSA